MNLKSKSAKQKIVENGLYSVDGYNIEKEINQSGLESDFISVLKIFENEKLNNKILNNMNMTENNIIIIKFYCLFNIMRSKEWRNIINNGNYRLLDKYIIILYNFIINF
ncbi:hypothetical protein [Spiroplasma endosymbiont of Amphibalanus improvisus]|uniref:hypothetical protein n=1 Tax=Spiroplasma endosymbiont of Amphibalanus improvisus TaxID=3066327 RepID=UPI00313C0295